MKKELIGIISVLILMAMVFAGCFDNGDDVKNQNGAIISEGSIYGEAIYGDIIIWTKEKSDGRYLYYHNIQEDKTIEFKGPINSGYTCSVFENYIVWIEINGDLSDLHLYDIESEKDTVIDSNVKRTALAICPLISKNNIVWVEEVSKKDNNVIYSLYQYSILDNSIETIVTNISNWRGLKFEDNIIVYTHDYYTNVSIYNLLDGTTTTLSKHNITDISYSDGTLVFAENYYDPPGGGLHVTCEGSFDEVFYTYNLETKEYNAITKKEEYRARPDIEGDKIVWMGGHTFETGLGGEVESDWDIFLYSISSGSETQLTATTTGEYGPILSGNNVIWLESGKGSLDSKLVLYQLK
jgi:hypothetical protein